MALSEKTVRVAGRNVHYWEDGAAHGRPLLLLHGGFGDAWTCWREVIPSLAENYHVIAPDLPGYSQSDALPRANAGALVAWLRGLMDAIEVEQAVLVGHSFAGLAARLLAASEPQRVPALVLVNGGVIPNPPAFARALALLPVVGPAMFRRIAGSTGARGELLRAFGNASALTDEFVARTAKNRDGLAALMRGLTLSRIPEARTPRIPVLLLWGEDDPVTPVWAAEVIQRGIPGAKLSLVAGCGHMPHVEAPDVFAAQVMMFLNNLDRSQRNLGGVGPLGAPPG